ncbi:MAG: hypothetical protein LBV80_07410 [Deltaproteobacteria bacterium]|jgi:hypothetical protein|nr:hypothetical protein [Deltaproteobacteria bacterium]
MSADANLKPPTTETHDPLVVKAIGPGTFISIFVIAGLFYLFSSQMGVKNMFGTIMATSFDLLINTAFFIMSVAVIAGAFSAFLSEFGVIALINKILSPLMGPVYRLPGAAALGVVTTFLSDNPAIVALAKDRDFIKYFTYNQRATLTNLGTAFGMGLIVATVMMAQSDTDEMMYAVGIGVGSAVIGSIISVTIMRFLTRTHYGDKGHQLIHVDSTGDDGVQFDIMKYRKIREGNFAQRTLAALLDGGKTGVELGFIITPGILIICTLVMMLVFGAPEGGYTGKAYEGIALVPMLAAKIDFILNPLFGFTTPEAIAFPCTAIGAVGAALGMVPGFLAKGLIGPNDIAVFTAIGMTWSGYLSTHVSMLDALGCRELTGKAILSHTVAGLGAGVAAHWLFVFIV